MSIWQSSINGGNIPNTEFVGYLADGFSVEVGALGTVLIHTIQYGVTGPPYRSNL